MSKNTKVIGKNSAGEEVISYVRRPNSKDYKEAKLYSTAIVSDMIRRKTQDGKPAFLVRSQLPDIRREAGIWTEEHAQKVVDLSKQIESLEVKLYAGKMKKSEGRDIAFKLEDLRREQLSLITRMNAMDENTIEAAQENSEFDYLVSVCALDEEGVELFESVDDYKERAADEPFYYAIAQELQNILYGFKQIEDSVKERPEYKFLSKFGFMNDKLELVDKDGNLVNRLGKRIDKEGYLINELGERVDRDGNKVDTNGNRTVEFGEFTDD